MKKIIVIGCPGSGKSTFSRALHQKNGIALFHLDLLFWNVDKTTVDEATFCQRLSEIIRQEEWIIDGNYASTMEQRLKACDTVFFLDYPLAVCLSGIEERKGKIRSDMPWIEDDEADDEFLEFIKSYREKVRPGVMKLLEKYADKKIYIFETREQADCFLKA